MALVHMCWGCSKAGDWSAAAGFTCTVYADPMKPIWARHNLPCPFNPVIVEEKKVKVRVGQQKGRRGKKQK